MLVLSRKEGESVQVGVDIVITVIKIWPNKVRIGIQAPREVPIRRDELPADGKKLMTYTEVEVPTDDEPEGT